jgi:hypothetical protein
MKITFFLIAFCLVFARLYLGWTGHWRNGGSDGTMTISNDDDDVEIKWSGKVNFNDDETAIASMTPGGYLRFRHNDEKLVAESNLQGDITYELYDGRARLVLDEKGQRFLAHSIHEMIEYGYDAKGRIDRIYKKGGTQALLEEEEKLKSDNMKGMYIDRLIKSDSLAKEDLTRIIKQIGGLGGDFEKAERLKRFSKYQLNDSGTVQAWLGVVNLMGDDHEKGELLKHLIDHDTLTAAVKTKILDITGHFGGDWEKENLLSQLIESDTIAASDVDQLLGVIGQFGDEHGKADLFSKLIDKNAIPPDHFDKLLTQIDHFGNDFEKENLYNKLIEKKELTEPEWDRLIKQTERIGSDFEKAELMVKMAKKMPVSDDLKITYMKAAKTINTDQEYGKALRALMDRSNSTN